MASKEDIARILAPRSRRIDESLKELLPFPESASSPEVKRYYEGVWDYNLRGGKRLRPALCMLSCSMFDGNEEDAVPTARSLELLQNFLLVHDDIEDESELRRGKPALHLLHGTGSAINIGDALHIFLWKSLLENKSLIGATKAFAVFREFVNQSLTTAEGQAIEIAWIRDGKFDVTEDEYFDLVSKKTANYTITTPLRLGAIIAGAPKRDADAFNQLGERLGKAFQIQDDVLNITASSEGYGKEAVGDLYEGKRTLMLVHLLKKIKGEERGEVIRLLAQPRNEKTPEQMQRVAELLKDKGSIDYAKKKAADLAVKAREGFDKKFAHAPENGSKKDLRELFDFLVNREY